MTSFPRPLCHRGGGLCGSSDGREGSVTRGGCIYTTDGGVGRTLVLIPAGQPPLLRPAGSTRRFIEFRGAGRTGRSL